MKIAVCGNDHIDSARILKLINGRYSTSVYSCARQLIEEMTSYGASFDLYIIELTLPDMSGTELARHIRERDEKAMLCFTAEDDTHYREAFDLFALQYLIKPVGEDDFCRMLDRAALLCGEAPERTIALSHRGKTVLVPCGDILYIESKGHTMFIYLKGGVVERQSGQLSAFEKQLDPEKFVRVHQSYIINIRSMDALQGSSFICGGRFIPISRKYSGVKEKYRAAQFKPE